MIINSGESAALFSAFFWALGIVLMKKGGEGLSIMARNFCRHCFVTLLFIFLMLFQGEAIPSFATLSVPLLLISSLLGIVVAETFFLKALSETETTAISITGMLYTPIVVLISVLFCKEILTLFEMIGGLFIVSGSLLAFPRFALFDDIQQHRRGYLYGVLSVVASSIGAVTMKPLLVETDLLGLLVLRIAIALPFLMLISRWRNGCVLLEIIRASPQGYRYLLGGAFFSDFLGTYYWATSMQSESVALVTMLGQTSIIFVLFFSRCLLSERITTIKIVSILVIFLGMLVTTVFE
jgi:drug/metabolite transporter (DMT)-like permease